MAINRNTDQFDIIVIGGGPAGMMAAGRAAERGAKVLLIEKTYRLGSKLLLTGGGRCNITNNAEIGEFINAFGKAGKFLYKALTVFSSQDLINFFTSRGVPMHIDPDGKVFPSTNSADSVLAVLRAYLKQHKVSIIYNHAFSTTDDRTLDTQKLIIATGGMSYPATGSTGDGYDLAKLYGHTIVPLSPGLTALESDNPFIKDLQGLTIKDIAISLIIDGKKKAEARGSILFTHFGVSGPIVLNLSGKVIDVLSNKSKVELGLNLRPNFCPQEFANILQKEFVAFGPRTVAQYFKKVLPASLSAVFEKRYSPASNKKCNMINRAERKIIAACFTDFRIFIIGFRPIEEAMITRGGVSLKEINPQTMESRRVTGLYFCGEMIDIAGMTGGYNLQAAFSTGYLAGEAAAGVL